ncbi:M61 family metallopeptidase [Gynurincola endophyticus]|uniref:M61 family metallopeptidase n=1 Tax=Gynurincola endophyticus TaxID=2479004 RepID=UPI000F8CBA86|nr:M61 family metallopeptidase [Gynurincola endophyticus]
MHHLSKTNYRYCLLAVLLFSAFSVHAQKPVIDFTINVPDPSDKSFEVRLSTGNWPSDTLLFKMPEWMPGYYQLMNYAADVENVKATFLNNKPVTIEKVNSNTWRVTGVKKKDFRIDYKLVTKRSFVAVNFVDTSRAYIAPANTFLYVDGGLDAAATVTIAPTKNWSRIATGLTPVANDNRKFKAADFDELYDCPILIGNLEELPAFKVKGKNHRFIGYQLGEFDKQEFMTSLQKMIEAATDLFGDIPYNEYTFIGIGPGRGGIEHLNNTTVSFNGNGLKTRQAKQTVLNFLAHEYVHHFNVKRIRPVELGPFDYTKPNRTNQLWISEGLTVYYEYIVLRKAGLKEEQEVLGDFERTIRTHENNQGKLHQSLQQASYNTWKDGPFGDMREEKGKTISYYDKGPLLGIILDFAIRHHSKNEKSLNNVMQYLYQHFYKNLKRGFTEAEFQEACEAAAGYPLSDLFEYVYTTKELDYNKYFQYAGLRLDVQEGKYKILTVDNPTSQQTAIYNSWMMK